MNDIIYAYRNKYSNTIKIHKPKLNQFEYFLLFIAIRHLLLLANLFLVYLLCFNALTECL